jgi:uncharacterized protein (TIGR00369 family)
MADEFRDNRGCFVCGEKNSAGLGLKFRMDKERGIAEVEVRFAEHFQGWENVVHGGLLATVLDEAMIYAAAAKGVRCVTGEITVRYVEAAPTGAALKLKGRFMDEKGRMILAESEILDPDGRVLARAAGKLIKI